MRRGARASVRVAAAALCLCLPSAVLGNVVGGVVGHVFRHPVEEGDSLSSLGARYGVEPAVLARLNGLPRKAALQPGDELLIDNRHVAPAGPEDGVVINVPQRMLFLLEGGRVEAAYPVAVGRRGWSTPAGSYHIVVKEEDPSWEVPPSIQREMRRQGQRVVRRVPPGPNNPLGQYWLGLSKPRIGIHGTPQENSIYRFVSHGCVRMHPDDIEALFHQVDVGTPVRVVYEPVLLGRDDDGAVYVEGHRDAYGRGRDPWGEAQRQAESLGLSPLVDWAAVRQVLSRREGLARVVGPPGTFTAEEE